MDGGGGEAELRLVGELQEATRQRVRSRIGLGGAAQDERAGARLREAGDTRDRNRVGVGSREGQHLARGDVEVARGAGEADVDVLRGDRGISRRGDITQEDPRTRGGRGHQVAGQLAAVERDRSEVSGLSQRVGGTAVERERDAVGNGAHRIIAGDLEEAAREISAGDGIKIRAQVDHDTRRGGQRRDSRGRHDAVVDNGPAAEGAASGRQVQGHPALLDDIARALDGTEQLIVDGVVKAQLSGSGHNDLVGVTEIAGVTG